MKHHWDRMPVPEREPGVNEQLGNELGERAERTVSGAEKLERECESFALENPEYQERANDIKKRLGAFKRRCRQAVMFVAMAASLGLGIEGHNYMHTRYRVETAPDKNGNITLRHEDTETTKILNYLGGRADLPADARHMMEIREFKKFSNYRGVPLPDNIAGMNEEQLSEAFDTMWKPAFEARTKEHYKDGLLKRMMPTRYAENDALYRSLWKIEQEAGNPKVRFGIGQHNESRATAHYDPGTNTMYIDYPAPEPLAAGTDRDVVESFVAEASHGKQWGASFGSYLKNDIKHILMKPDRVKVEKNGFLEIEQNQTKYNTPGTIEYEAHKVIQPGLEQELPENYRSTGGTSRGDQ